MLVPSRIRNQYLLQLLSVVVRLGCTGISSRLYVEACRDFGLSVNDSYFMHFDTLFDYGFLVMSKNEDRVVADTSSDNKLNIDEDWDTQFSLTHEGREYLDRFGGR